MDDVLICREINSGASSNFLEEVDPIEVGVMAGTLLCFAYFNSNHVFISQ